MRFVMSARHPSDLPASTTEVAIVGRSNVGKSSLINSLTNRHDLAHVSKTPGRTQLLNLFEMAGGGTLVDMPGYGYAAVPGRVKAEWAGMIHGYLLGREELVMVVVLVDGEIGPTKLDVQMLDWLRAHQLPVAVVATKHDKVKSSVRAKRKTELAAGCGLEPSDVLWVSAAKGTGVDQVRDKVRSWLYG
jgi:GTP-binding protein